MSTALSNEEFLRNLRESKVFTDDEVDALLRELTSTTSLAGESIADRLIASDRLTRFQAAALQKREFNDLVIGNYQVLDKLGSGGMGTVYKARHRRMKRIVAIKVLSKTIGQTPALVQRFIREAEAVARLSHPNIVMAYDADEAEVGHYLVMEFINGQDLASVVQQGGPLSIAEAVEAIVQAGRALDYAHRQGIVHRDVKPANMLRDVGGVVKLADLGLARINDPLGKPSSEAGGITQSGTIMGTVDYMPPEQALGLANVDKRADIYSLGCSIYYLISGAPPYPGPTIMAAMLMHRDSPIPALRSPHKAVPPELNEIFRRMVAKKPADRYSTMAETVAALEMLQLEPVKPSPATTSDFLPPTSKPAGLATSDFAIGASATVDLSSSDDTEGTSDVVHPVLLIEPSRSQAVIIRKHLEKLGFPKQLTATKGHDALELARSSPLEAVVCAMHLPDMTGLQLAHDMRRMAQLAGLGFVLITSQDDAGESDLTIAAENAVRLSKPFGAHQLGMALESARSLAGGKSARKQFRALIVDDSAAARAHFRRVLSDLECDSIREAADGVEAMFSLETEAFDIVVTDYNMPRLDGQRLVEFIRRRSRCPDVLVIMATTETEAEKLDPVRKLGVAAICDKKLDPEVVRRIIASLG